MNFRGRRGKQYYPIFSNNFDFPGRDFWKPGWTLICLKEYSLTNEVFTLSTISRRRLKLSRFVNVDVLITLRMQTDDTKNSGDQEAVPQ
jgi:hypothetical protein